MMNWNFDKDVIMRQTENAIIGELACLLGNTRPTASANYWLDNRHNVFATIAEDGDDKWLDIRLEMYDVNDDWIGDLYMYDTTDMSVESLERTVTEIVKDYYGE